MVSHFRQKSQKAVSGDFETSLNDFLAQAYSLSDFYETYFRTQGVVANILPANVEYLQDLWCQEHGIESRVWSQRIQKQLEFYKPNIVMVDEVSFFRDGSLNKFRILFPNVKVWFCSHCSPISATSYNDLKQYDFVMTCCPGIAEDLSARGIPSQLVRHAFFPGILYQSPPKSNRHIPLSFVGSLIPGYGFHGKRYQLISFLVEGGTGLKIYGDLKAILVRLRLLKAILVRLHSLMEALIPAKLINACPCSARVNQWSHVFSFPVNPSISKAMLPAVYGLDMYAVLGDSLITLNNHGDIAHYAANMRLYEATGMGACLLTDWKPDLGDLFELETEVVTYRTPEECLEKAKYLSEHPDIARKIGEAGQKRCLQDHTTSTRAQELLDILRKRLVLIS
jgi:hypothetical protein